MDFTVRTLRRRATVGGPRDQARLLQARLRAGEVPRWEVELASYLGHPAARALLGVRPSRACASDPVFAWLEPLSAWGDALPTRAALVAAWIALPLWESPEGDVPARLPRGYCCEWCTPLGSLGVEAHDYDDRPRRALLAAEACLSDPESEEQALQAAAAVAEATEGWRGEWPGLSAAAACAAAAEAAAAVGTRLQSVRVAAESLQQSVAALRSGWGYAEPQAWSFLQEAASSCLLPGVPGV